MRLRFVLLVLPSLVLAASVAARGEILERVIAKVNGEIITLTDFQARQVSAAQAARVEPERVSQFLRQNNARILQDAIDEILLLQRAGEAGLKLRPEYVDDVIQNIKKENGITSDEQLQAALRREGMTYDDLRHNIERSMTRRMIVQRDIEPKIGVTDEECRAEYEARKGEFTKPATVRLQEILVTGSSGGLELGRELAQRARGGEDFGELARTYSTASTRSSGGELGELAQGDLNPEIEKVAFALPVGAVSDPVPIGDSWRIIKVVAKTSGSVVPFETAQSTIRERLMMARYEKEYEVYMQELRKSANVELRVREVPLQLSGPVPEGGLLDALDPFAPAPAPSATEPVATPPPSGAEEEITATPQARPERVVPAAEKGERKDPPPP